MAVRVSARTCVIHEWVTRDGRLWGLALVTYQVDALPTRTMAVLVNEDDMGDGD